MIIKEVKRFWIKEAKHGPRYNDNSYYKTSAWKRIVDAVWARDKSMCQMCLEKGIKHPLVRGTKDRSQQGTVDHKVQRIEFGTDQMDNLWLIGTNHHDAKSASEKNAKYSKK